jgi:hypothetical protein
MMDVHQALIPSFLRLCVDRWSGPDIDISNNTKMQSIMRNVKIANGFILRNLAFLKRKKRKAIVCIVCFLLLDDPLTYVCIILLKHEVCIMHRLTDLRMRVHISSEIDRPLSISTDAHPPS